MGTFLLFLDPSGRLEWAHFLLSGPIGEAGKDTFNLFSFWEAGKDTFNTFPFLLGGWEALLSAGFPLSPHPTVKRVEGQALRTVTNSETGGGEALTRD